MDKRGVRPTIAREGSNLDFVRRGPYRTTQIVRARWLRKSQGLQPVFNWLQP